MSYNPPMIPTSRAGIASSIANHQFEVFKQTAGITEPSLAELRRQKRQRRTVTVIVGAVAGLTVLFSLAAMAVAASSITYFAFCLPIVLAPALIVQRRFLNKAPTLRGQIHLMREQVSRLAQTNLLFGRENDRLVAENARLGEIEERLAQTARQNGTNLHDMMILIKENSAIQKKTKTYLEGQEVQKLLQAVYRADTNSDMHLTEAEFDQLVLRLKGLNVVGKDRVRKVILQSSMGQSVMSLYRDFEEEVMDDEEFDMSSSTRQVYGEDAMADVFAYTKCLD